MKAKSNRPHTIEAAFTEKNIGQLKEILHQSPRNFGKQTSLCTLDLLAEVSYSEGITKELVSRETVRQALKRFGISWKQAKRWINNPDAKYTLKKKQRDRLMKLAKHKSDWVFAYQDETWWSRYANPRLHS